LPWALMHGVFFSSGTKAEGKRVKKYLRSCLFLLLASAERFRVVLRCEKASPGAPSHSLSAAPSRTNTWHNPFSFPMQKYDKMGMLSRRQSWLGIAKMLQKQEKRAWTQPQLPVKLLSGRASSTKRTPLVCTGK